MQRWLPLMLAIFAMTCGACGEGRASEQGADSSEDSPASEPACIARSMQALNTCADHDTLLRGVDISAWQGEVDWSAIAGDGVVFAFVRVSDGVNYPDKYFTRNFQGAKAHGVVRGVYQFFRPTQDPVAQAQLMIDAIDAAGGLEAGDLPPVLDLEDDDGVSPEDYKARAHAWIDYVEAHTGRRPIVYTAAFFSDFVGESFADHPLWVANYKSTYEGTCPAMPSGFDDWVVWQWTDKGSVAGIAGGVDEDVFDGTRAELDALIRDSHLEQTDSDAGAGAASDAGAEAADAGAPSEVPHEPVSDTPDEVDAGSGHGAAMGAGHECDEASASDESASSDADAASGCPDAPEAPAIDATDAAHFCPQSFAYDATFHLCVNDQEALGPFTPAMIAACRACGGLRCDERTWPVAQARGLRGTGACMPGSTPEEHGLCVDELSAYGPFSPAHVERCIAAGGGEGACRGMRWDRAFAVQLLSTNDASPTEKARAWSYILPLNYGIRDDGQGAGHFGASRTGNAGGHSGIDFLAPIGTALLAPCEGDAVSGVASGYGNYVQLVCAVPDELAQGESLWASVFFAHLSVIDIAASAHVARGQKVGEVGRTGNASTAGVGPHVHFEVAIHASANEAFGETHASADHSATAASDVFAPLFERACLTPFALAPVSGPTMKGRRPDPFMLLACLAAARPRFTAPSTSLQDHAVPWSEHYRASFDVDGAS